MSITNSFVAGPAVQIGSVGGNVTIALDRPDYQVQWLGPTPAQATYIPKRHRAPSYLLNTRREVVPYRNRPVEEQRLLDWLASPAPVSVLLLHGAGGRGKTRLANAFTTHSHATGWSVAHALNRATDRPSMLPTPTPGSTEPGQHILVTVDYAERWPADTLLTLISDLARTHATATLRVLLLSRSVQDLWQPLCDQLDTTAIELPEPIELLDLTDSVEARAGAFLDAAQAFHGALELIGNCTTTPPDDLGHEDYASPLILHMTALAAVCAERDHEELPQRDELSGYLLAHERRSWPPHPNGGDAVFLATLFGPIADEKGALGLLDIAGVTHSTAASRALLTWHDRVYPSPHDLPPLLPDRFGEDYIADHLRTHPRASALVERVIESDNVGMGPVRRCATVLVATASRHSHVREVLWKLMSKQRRLLAFPTPALLRLAIADAPFHVQVSIGEHLPRPEVGLRELGLELSLRMEQNLPSDTPLPEQIAVLAGLVTRLLEADHGDRRALSLIRRIMSVVLTASTRDRAGSELPVAQILLSANDYVARNLGRANALASIDVATDLIRGSSAPANPSHRTTLLIFALIKRTKLLISLQRTSDAVESAVEALGLAERAAEDGLDLANLAAGTAVLANQFTTLGKPRAAARAAGCSANTYLKLALSQPEVYAERTASGYTATANALVLADKGNEAVQMLLTVIDLMRKWIPINPRAFEPLLAQLLHNAALIQFRHGAAEVHPPPRELVAEAVALYRVSLSGHPWLASKLEEGLSLQREIENR
ncbi:hypothetical protein ACIA8G_01250 [Lentzea sp. NPDC051213]|uniref:hypothetical protein n=1 Tax=Lentzea sp. NPDC051213 TaxID=3364126 RepID=UPI00379BA801